MIIFLVVKKSGSFPSTTREECKEVDMAALFGGLAALVVGIIGIIIWWGYFLKALAAGIPALLILGGALATYLGIEELKDKRSAEKFEEKPDTSELKEEVASLKKELENLKKEE
jgi:small neutral amino acid transporter SnatA (MarC family)